MLYYYCIRQWNRICESSVEQDFRILLFFYCMIQLFLYGEDGEYCHTVVTAVWYTDDSLFGEYGSTPLLSVQL